MDQVLTSGKTQNRTAREADSRQVMHTALTVDANCSQFLAVLKAPLRHKYLD